MQKLWAFHEAYGVAEAEALGKVALVLVTTDVALKIYGKAASGGSPAMRLMKQKKATALIMDEIQRCPAETYIALASRNTTVVAVGDRGQELYPLVPQDRGVLQVQTFANHARPSFAAELLLARSSAAPGAPDTAAVYHLTETKRFGNPLAEYLARGHPGLCPQLRASAALAKTTGVSHIWYKAPCNTWYNLGYFLGQQRNRNLQQGAAWQLSAAVWHDGLFTVLAAHILLLLQNEAANRRA
jgi:hypothetical protein